MCVQTSENDSSLTAQIGRVADVCQLEAAFSGMHLVLPRNLLFAAIALGAQHCERVPAPCTEAPLGGRTACRSPVLQFQG